MRPVFRIAPTLAVAVALAAPVAQAAPTATTAATAPTPAPSSGGSAFGPLQGMGTSAATSETTVTGTKRAGDTGSGRSTLLFLSLVALVMIAGVGVFIWYEGAKVRTTQAKRRRQRMRAGRPAQAAAAMSAGDRRSGGPPPPPRKRRSQAKRKKR